MVVQTQSETSSGHGHSKGDGDVADYLAVSRTDWPIRHIVNRNVLTCSPETLLSQAAALMAERACSSILVLNENGAAIGIWTEHDVLDLDLDDPCNMEQPIKRVMSSPVFSFPAETSLETLVLQLRGKNIRHVVVTEGNALAGIISQTDIIRNQGIHSYLTLRDVGSLVRTSALVVDASESLNVVARRLREQRGEAAVVRHQGALHGIITERDILRFAARNQASNGVVSCLEICSHPLLSVQNTTPLVQAHDLMERKHIRHLAVLDEEGDLVSLLSFRDILAGIELDYTRFLQAAIARQGQAIRQGQQRQRQIIEATQEGFYEIDLLGNIIRVNDALCTLLDRPPHELIGVSPLSFYALESHAIFLENLAKIHQQPHRNYELTALRRDNTLIPVKVSASTLYNDAGEATGAFAFLVDLSHQYQQRQELQALLEQVSASNAELESFAYVVSHDLQQPLRMITSYLGLLGRRYSPDLTPEAQEFIGYAVDGAKRMQSMIMDLLEYSRINRQGKDPDTCDSGESLDLALRSVGNSLAACGGTLSHSDMPTVLADPRQLERVFQCLLDNAIIYRDSQRPLQIQLSAQQTVPGTWQFCVQDNGIGIEPQHFERIFQVFQRLHPRTEASLGASDTLGRGNGNGIGLALCKRIIERLGGKVWVESELGQGTTFFFTLLAPPEEQPETRLVSLA